MLHMIGRGTHRAAFQNCNVPIAHTASRTQCIGTHRLRLGPTTTDWSRGLSGSGYDPVG